jgi:bifunctional enzyme CysN/CysC
VLDGDNVRHGLNKDLGFTDADRVENIRRVAEVSKLFVDAGLIVLVSFISPFRAERRMARDLWRTASSSRSSSTRRSRSAESAIRRASTPRREAGQIKNFTGIDSPYEAPEQAEIHLATAQAPAEIMAERVVDYLREHRLID